MIDCVSSGTELSLNTDKDMGTWIWRGVDERTDGRTAGRTDGRTGELVGHNGSINIMNTGSHPVTQTDIYTGRQTNTHTHTHTKPKKRTKPYRQRDGQTKGYREVDTHTHTHTLKHTHTHKYHTQCIGDRHKYACKAQTEYTLYDMCVCVCVCVPVRHPDIQREILQKSYHISCLLTSAYTHMCTS